MSKTANGGQEKKQTQTHATTEHSTPVVQPQKGGKSTGPLPGGCHAQGCKGAEKRFSFCPEHYEQFKFGLIKKTGEPVSDYEKKFEHYQAWRARQAAQKVA